MFLGGVTVACLVALPAVLAKTRMSTVVVATSATTRVVL
jgi:hypothetical protein